MANEGGDWRKGHRARLREKFLDDKLTDCELVELLLCQAIPRVDVKPAAKELMKKFGNIQNIVAADIAELRRCAGVGEGAAVLFAAIKKFMLSAYRGEFRDAPLFYDTGRLYDYCRLLLSKARVEEFHIFYLDADNRLIQDDLHTAGTKDHVAVYPREVLQRAMALNARNVVLVHNHPDGTRSFSTDDIELTQKVKEKLAVDGIGVLDHLLVSDGLIFSAKNMFLI
jgi:DNA repair protein RadC